MKRVVKRGLEIGTVLIFTMIIMLVLGNYENIANKRVSYNDANLYEDDMEFYHWNKSDGNIYISEEDPQIIICGINNYVNNFYVNVELSEVGEKSSQIIVYYKEKGDVEFSPEKVLYVNSDKSNKQIEISLKRDVTDLRLDLTELQQSELKMNSIVINPTELRLQKTDFLLGFIIVIGALLTFCYRKVLYDLYTERELLIKLIKNDLKSRYAGSFFGLIWAFVQPIMTILVFWVVFELGFRTAPVNNITYILWFVPAYIPWIYFSDAVVNSSNCLREYSYLVKKMKFNVKMLPIMKVFSSIIIHIFFVTFMMIIFVVYQYHFTLMAFQLLYYAFALTVLLMGVAWLTSAISVFMKDFTQIISILLQIGFFMIPIFWNDADMNPIVLMVLKLNPVYYIVQGYRESLLDGICFWDRPMLTAYYWIVTFAIFIVGIKLFDKLRNHFADLI